MLRARSIDEPEWFWDAVVHFLGIPFATPYDRVLDVSRGIPWATWFDGRHAQLRRRLPRPLGDPRPTRVAIVWEGEDGETRTWTYGELHRAGRRHRPPADRARRRCRRRGRHLPPDGARDGRRAAGAIAKLGAAFLPIFSRLRRRRGRDPPRRRRRQGAHHRRRLLRGGATASPCWRGRAGRGALRQRADDRRDPAPRVGARRQPSHGRTPSPDGRSRRRVGRRASIRCSSRTRPAPRAGPRARCTCTVACTVKVAEEVAFQTDCGPGDTLFWLTDMGWIMGPWEIIGRAGERRHARPVRRRARLPEP